MLHDRLVNMSTKISKFETGRNVFATRGGVSIFAALVFGTLFAAQLNRCAI
jgi:drug/metabolite transporter superfamily protein YnfA